MLLGGEGMERGWRGTKDLEGKDGACMMVSCEDYGKDVDSVSANACAWRCSVFGCNETQMTEQAASWAYQLGRLL